MSASRHRRRRVRLQSRFFDLGGERGGTSQTVYIHRGHEHMQKKQIRGGA